MVTDIQSYISTKYSFDVLYCSYEKYVNSEGKTMYATVGYTTVFLYYAYPQHIRPRISQMLVLPPFQKLGIGSKMIQVSATVETVESNKIRITRSFQAIYNRFQFDEKVVDITVEDPSDEFRRIRNVIDVRNCKDLKCFAVDKIKNGFTTEMLVEAKKKFKVNNSNVRIETNLRGENF